MPGRAQIPCCARPEQDIPFGPDFAPNPHFQAPWYEIRNHTATHRRPSGKSWRPVSTNSRSERTKENTAGETQLTYSCRRARLGALPARCNTFAVSDLIFVARLLRRCFVLSSLTPAARFLSAWRPFPFSIPWFVKPPARWSGKCSREQRRQRLLLSG